MKQNKKIISSLIIIVLVFTFIVVNNSKKNNLVELNYTKFMEKINRKENFVLMISQTTCNHCRKFKPILKKIAKENKFEIYYIEYNILNQDEKKQFDEIVNFDSTPTTIFIKDGEEESMANRIDGVKNKQYIINKLKSNGFIK